LALPGGIGEGVLMTSPLGRARALLAEHPLIDGHNDLPYELRGLVSYDLARYDVGVRQDRTHTDLVRLAEGGVGGQFWSVFTDAGPDGERAVAETLEQIDAVHALIARYPDRLALALTADDVEKAQASGRIASLLGAEGGHSIASSLGVLRSLHALGVRYLTLTHNYNVPWADSATDEERLGGLSDFGRDVVREMNRIGMLVDLSHVSPGTMRDALATTSAPVIFSHSSARAVCDHPRNVPDDVLELLAANGGVCMVTFVPGFVSRECREWENGLRAAITGEGLDARQTPGDAAAKAAFQRIIDRYAAANPAPRATIAQVADHIEHVRDVAGAAHVGIGGDYDGTPDMPIGLDDVTGYPALIAELIDRGWADPDLASLTRGNILRVMRDAESVALA
jgi:membrane dipeptidase